MSLSCSSARGYSTHWPSGETANPCAESCWPRSAVAKSLNFLVSTSKALSFAGLFEAI
jgi:hypothetical protein